MLPGTTPEQALQVVERMRARLAEVSFDDLAPGLQVTFSAGLAGRSRRADARGRDRAGRPGHVPRQDRRAQPHGRRLSRRSACRPLRPQHPHPQRLLHAPGLRLGVVAPAPEVVGAHRAGDRAAGVLRHHQAAQRRVRQRLGACPARPACRRARSAGRPRSSGPASAARPARRAGRRAGSGSGSSRKNTYARVAPQHLVHALRVARAPRPDGRPRGLLGAAARPGRSASGRPTCRAGRCGRRRPRAPAARCRRPR